MANHNAIRLTPLLSSPISKQAIVHFPRIPLLALNLEALPLLPITMPQHLLRPLTFMRSQRGARGPHLQHRGTNHWWLSQDILFLAPLLIACTPCGNCTIGNTTSTPMVMILQPKFARISKANIPVRRKRTLGTANPKEKVASLVITRETRRQPQSALTLTLQKVEWKSRKLVRLLKKQHGFLIRLLRAKM